MAFGSLGAIDSRKARLHRELKDRIATGRYEPGTQFPSEVELVEQFGVSRSTVRSALSALEAEGLILRRWGVGTFVSDSQRQQIANPISEAWDFRDLIAASGFVPDVAVGPASSIEADARDAAELGVSVGSPLLRVEKVFLADGEPVIYAVNRMPVWVLGEPLLSEALARPQITEPVYAFLEERCGQRIGHHVATLHAQLVRDCELPIAGVDPLTPVLTMRSIAFSHEDRPVFESCSTYPDPRVQLRLIRRQAAASLLAGA